MRGKKSMRNRMIRIKIASLMAGLVAAVSLEGCGLFTKSYDFTEAENSIYVEDNATIRAAMISDFDKDYYSIDELAGVAQQEALSFNKNVYDCSYYSYDQMTKEEKESILLPVCYEKAVVKDKKASVVFTYAMVIPIQALILLRFKMPVEASFTHHSLAAVPWHLAAILSQAMVKSISAVKI